MIASRHLAPDGAGGVSVRLVFRRKNGETIGFGLPVVIIGVLVLLALLGGLGVAMFSKDGPTPQQIIARMGAKKNYAALPEMSMTLGGGGRSMDVRVLLELDPKVDPRIAEPYAARIADRLSDRMRDVEPERLVGAEGAQFMKSTITSVVEREIRTIKVRDVMLERMVTR